VGAGGRRFRWKRSRSRRCRECCPRDLRPGRRSPSEHALHGIGASRENFQVGEEPALAQGVGEWPGLRCHFRAREIVEGRVGFRVAFPHNEPVAARRDGIAEIHLRLAFRRDQKIGGDDIDFAGIQSGDEFRQGGTHERDQKAGLRGDRLYHFDLDTVFRVRGGVMEAPGCTGIVRSHLQRWELRAGGPAREQTVRRHRQQHSFDKHAYAPVGHWKHVPRETAATVATPANKGKSWRRVNSI
jgi:hypothetical protein